MRTTRQRVSTSWSTWSRSFLTLPGADEDTPLVIVSRSECIVEGHLTLGPTDWVAAYR
jgi:hypothetical protein